MFKLIDTHAHIDEVEDIDNVITQAKSNNVAAIVALGMSLTSNRRVLELAAKYPAYVYPAMGLFPSNIADADFAENMRFIQDNIGETIGIGEIGLDYSKRVKEKASKETQKSVFKELLELAKQHHKPALIHSRYSWRDCLELTQAIGIKKAIFHWYTGPLDILEKIIDCGYFISASPAAEYFEEHRKAIQAAPLENIVLETDTPVTYRYGTEFAYESRPSDILRTLNAVSEIKNIDKNIVAETVFKNTQKIFEISV
ncbi:MAG: TatD family hydrolase [Dehalococcoidales bacterium]